jgi:DNA polymerase III alpha subunit
MVALLVKLNLRRMEASVSFPQLRVRTGMSFRDCYGRMPEIMSRLKEVGADSAAIVDSNTFGHVRWEKEAKKAGITPMFGMEVPIITIGEDGEPEKIKPRAWILAKDTKAFYNATSKCVQNGGMTPEEFEELVGVIRFPGGALDKLQPEHYDYIDINPSSYVLAARGVTCSRLYDKPMVITGYNDMPSAAHERFATAWEVRDSVGVRTIESEGSIWEVLKLIMTRDEFMEAGDNTRNIALDLKDVVLQKAPIISLDGDMVALCREGQKSRLARGHIKEWTDEYEQRLVMEIEQIQLKKFDSYFLAVADLVSYAKRHMLVGPARGSSAGSLACYVLGITEVDPIPHDLLFQRFIDISRADLPDIDIDFADTKRHLVFEYLVEKYGARNVAKLGNINTLQALSVMAQVGKRIGISVSETSSIRNALITYSSGDARYGKGLEDTFTSTEPGKAFRASFPKAAECMSEIEIHYSHSGVHAAGILVCNEPIQDFCTVNAEGVGQIDKPDSEYLNLPKIDALGLRTLGIIEDSGVVTAEQLYSLPLDDQSVLDILNDDKMSGIFQFEGEAARATSKGVKFDSFSKIDNITALARPGPLASGMAHRYKARSLGDEPVTYDVPQLEKYLSNTFGVFLYQEQIMSVVKEIGLFDWVKTSAVRKAMSGSKGEEYFNAMGADFIAGATSQGVPEEQAKKIWKEMVTFGSWGFNKSHSVSYAIVTYWTCWLKRYHKIEFAAACLRAAKDDEQTIAILRELAKEGVSYTALDPDYSDMQWRAADGRLIGGIQNAKGFGPVKALKYVQEREKYKEKLASGFPVTKKEQSAWEKARDSLAKAEVQYADLCEAHTKFGHFYRDPSLAGVTSGRPIHEMRTAPRGSPRDGDVLIIGKLVKKVISDENEAIRQKKRGGKPYKGAQSVFLDMMMVDDSVDTPIRFRIRPEKYMDIGKSIADEGKAGQWYLMRGWKLSGNMDMFIIKNIKRIDNTEPITHRGKIVGMVTMPGAVQE